MNHISLVISEFWADVMYEEDECETIIPKNTHVIWQHSYVNNLIIIELQPPHYNDFDFRWQKVEFISGALIINGHRHDNLMGKYKVTLK